MQRLALMHQPQNKILLVCLRENVWFFLVKITIVQYVLVANSQSTAYFVVYHRHHKSEHRISIMYTSQTLLTFFYRLNEDRVVSRHFHAIAMFIFLNDNNNNPRV